FVCPPDVTCPNCQTRLETDPARTAPRPGDRILVHMWPYAIGGPFGPHRWDVVVFRDPVDPTQHYIKRLVGLPGESVELLDGDLFINGCIQRKPPWVQSVLWFIVYDQAHLPAAGTAVGELPRWIPRDPPSAGAVGWTGVDTRVIRYDGLDQTFRRLAFNADTNREYLSDFYAYDRRSSGTFVGDVRLVTDLTFDAGDDGLCEFEIIRPPHRYIAEVRPHGLATLRIESAAGRAQQARGPVQFQPPPQGQPFHVEFGHVDCRVYLKIAGREVLAEEYAPEVERLRLDPGTRPVNLQIAACNVRLSLASLRIDRDVHYTAPLPQTRRAAAGAPFTLRADEHFMLGDNSPDSHDSREWAEAGPHMPSGYRPGTVLRNQIVGQAAFVYLPGLLPVDPAGRWHVPDLGRARFVR
ncbi:MAG: S26 family signal peptidase, partial [Planctomycetota bacterium]